MKVFFAGLLLGIFIGCVVTAYFNSPESFQGLIAPKTEDSKNSSEKLENLKESAKETLESGKEKAAKLAENVKEKSQEALESGKDLKIAVAIRSKFKLDKDIDSEAIRIEVDDGMVKLSGSVPTYEMASQAIEKAAEADGVKGVESELIISANQQ